ncbi:F-box only protein 39 [Phaenicophaeus curvirostris]|uniref:F-box only protein 39 n=1 Tax=Phaenicophaeus curvirostris TaxID=33595 RepID=UPI0037F0AA80
MEEESEPEQSAWAYLPDTCLRHVFHWLDDKDRVQAALVCKKWSGALHFGSLWRSRTITFHGQPLKANKLEFVKALWFIKKFSKYLEHLEVKLSNFYKTNATQNFLTIMRGLFSHLGKYNRRLEFLSIEHLGLDRPIWKSRGRAQFIKTLALFLKKKRKHLKYLNLKGARVSLEDGCELLNCLSWLTNKSSISEMNIEDFFHTHLHVHSSTLFHQTMSKFHNLVTLTVNYNCVSDELLDILREKSAHSLCTLNIKCHSNDPHQQVVSGTSWANLVKRAPKLSMNFSFDKILKHDHLARILKAVMPLKSIILQGGYFSDPAWIMIPTITDLLPAYRHTLQRLTLELNNSEERLDNELLQFILSCRRLLFLKVWAFLSVTFVEKLLQNRARRDCILTTIHVRIYTNKQETSEEDQLLRDIYRKFKNLIDSELDYFALTCPLT